MTINKTAFRNNLSKALKERGMTQTDLSRMTGLNRPAINKWMRGVNLPHTDTLAIVCMALKISADDLLAGVVEP